MMVTTIIGHETQWDKMLYMSAAAIFPALFLTYFRKSMLLWYRCENVPSEFI